MPVVGAGYLGDFAVGATVRCLYTTRDSTGAPAQVTGGPMATRVYKDANNVETATGITSTEGWDGQAGQHLMEVDTSASSSFYTAGSDFFIVTQSGSIGGIALGPSVIAQFSIENRSINTVKTLVQSK